MLLLLLLLLEEDGHDDDGDCVGGATGGVLDECFRGCNVGMKRVRNVSSVR